MCCWKSSIVSKIIIVLRNNMKQLQLRMHVKSCITHGKYKKQIARRACGWYPHIEESTFTKTNKSVYFAFFFYNDKSDVGKQMVYMQESNISYG